MDNLQPALFNASAPVQRLAPADFPFFQGARKLAAGRLIAEDWVPVLEPLDAVLRELAVRLSERSAAGERILPEPALMLRALQLPRAQVKVLVIGQDPYPTAGHANGLAFAANAAVRPLPRSLANIYRELESDLGLSPAPHADLTAWHAQGVLLLNRALSVAEADAGAHLKLGWEPVVQAVITALNDLPVPPVALLWGRHAQKLGVLMGRMPQVASAHPSPLSASRGFFGSRPFSHINRLLTERGQQPIEWEIPRV